MSVPPSEAGCWSLPSIFVGRPRWLSTSSGLAYPPSVTRGGVVHRAAGDDVFGLAHVGDDGLEREADASGHAARQAERGAHDFEESAARDGVDPFGGAFGEFAVQGFLEFFGAGEFFERAPVFGAGFFRGVVGGGGVDAFADDVQVQFFRRTDVFAFFDLDQIAGVFFVVRHVLRITFLSPLRGLLLTTEVAPQRLKPRSVLLSNGTAKSRALPKAVLPKIICDRCCRW